MPQVPPETQVPPEMPETQETLVKALGAEVEVEEAVVLYRPTPQRREIHGLLNLVALILQRRGILKLTTMVARAAQVPPLHPVVLVARVDQVVPVLMALERLVPLGVLVPLEMRGMRVLALTQVALVVLELPQQTPMLQMLA